jgi:hypothetical protein
MRMGELLRSDVVDVDGKRVGRVHDVRLVQDGPELAGSGPSLRVDGLVVGHGSLAIRLGYHRAEVTGPFLLGRIFRALEGRARYVRWTDIQDRTTDRITLRCSTTDLTRIPDIS